MLIFRFLARESFHEITVREFAFLSTHSVNLLTVCGNPLSDFTPSQKDYKQSLHFVRNRGQCTVKESVGVF